jgi:hypothetical protein
MANRKHLKLLKKSIKVWNHWRARNRDVTPKLGGANLGGADLGHADLNNIHLAGAELSGAILCNTNLGGANLSLANLSRANLGGASLHYADLFATGLDRADLSGAHMGGTNIADTDLSDVTGLDTVVHERPSSIGIDTLYKSRGKIPDEFLRGAGVPEHLITYAHSLVNKPFDFYSCFISYSSKDQAFAERLHTDLEAKHVRCWLFSEDAK